MPLKIGKEGRWLSFQIRVQPRTRRTQVVGLWADALKIRLAEPPDKGRANQALLRFPAEILQVRTHQIRLLTGALQNQNGERK